MTHPFLFKEYVWLVKTIYEHRRLSLGEINQLWVDTNMSGGVEMARSTFNRHKDAIEDIFGIFQRMFWYCCWRQHSFGKGGCPCLWQTAPLPPRLASPPFAERDCHDSRLFRLRISSPPYPRLHWQPALPWCVGKGDAACMAG